MKIMHLKNSLIGVFWYVPLTLGLLSATSEVSPEPEHFVAATPCDLVMRPLLKIPAAMDCELVRWNLALRRIPSHAGPSTFVLDYVYGMSKPGTQGLTDGHGKGHMEGSWKELPNKGNLPGKIIVTLKPNGPGPAFSFLSLNLRLIHLLDEDGNLMIGNAGWSYTLNGTGAKSW